MTAVARSEIEPSRRRTNTLLLAMLILGLGVIEQIAGAQEPINRPQNIVVPKPFDAEAGSKQTGSATGAVPKKEGDLPVLSTGSDKTPEPPSPFSEGFSFADFFGPAQPPVPGAEPLEWPDISKPGPDMGDFPNSAYTLPRGRAYIENAPMTLQSGNAQNIPAYSWPFLLRYGVTDDVEFRMLGGGLTSDFGDNSTTGFSPLILDIKVHMWDGRKELYVPACSLEVAIQTDWGSAAFDMGTLPSINLNFDLELAKKTNLEWTLGYGSTDDPVRVISRTRMFKHRLISDLRSEDLDVNQFSAQWAVEQDLTEEVQVFIHGYYLAPIPRVQGSATAIGAGGFYKLSKRLSIFGSCNAGLSEAVPPIFGQLGFAFAL